VKYFIEIEGQKLEVELPIDDSESVLVDNKLVSADVKEVGDKGVLSCIVDGVPYLMNLEKTDDGYRVHVNGVDVKVNVADERAMSIRKLIGKRASKRDSAGDIKAPMPGLVVKLLINEGDEVSQGQGVIVVEAMKMENEIASPVDGKVKAIKVEEGQAVNKNDLMIVIKGNGE
jgi:biotin carboxyl carrier protein